jgi:microcystin-dependent protein
LTIFNTLPYTFINGTTADASQVDANFEQIISNGNANAAKNEVNSDITSLTALTTPPTGLGSIIFTAGAATGTANAIQVTPSPAAFTLVAGNTVRFIASANNTGATTLQVNGTSVLNVLKLTASGLAPLTGGEIVAGQVVDAFYDGTQYQMVTQNTYTPVTVIFPGHVSLFAANTPPTGWLECNGAAVSTTTYAALYAAIGTTFGSGSGTFNLPDLRGYFARGWDHGAGVDAGRAFGSTQQDQMQGHFHSTVGLTVVGISFGGSNIQPTSGASTTGSPVSDGVNGTPRYGTETRPKNVALMYIIKT